MWFVPFQPPKKKKKCFDKLHIREKLTVSEFYGKSQNNLCANECSFTINVLDVCVSLLALTDERVFNETSLRHSYSFSFVG